MRIYEILGKPVAWKRARRCGNRYFDPQVKEKEMFRTAIKIKDKVIYSPSDPLKVYMEFHMPIPESWSLKKRLSAINTPHVFTSDLDNKIKFICDTFNGILWQDDAQIYEIHARKFYSEEPKTIISIEIYEEEQMLSILPK